MDNSFCDLVLDRDYGVISLSLLWNWKMHFVIANNFVLIIL